VTYFDPVSGVGFAQTMPALAVLFEKEATEVGILIATKSRERFIGFDGEQSDDADQSIYPAILRKPDTADQSCIPMQ